MKRYHNRIRIQTFMIVIVVALIGIISCNGEETEQNTEMPPILDFQVDLAKIGGGYCEKALRIKFHPPKNWNLASHDILRQANDKILAQLLAEDNDVLASYRALFLNKQNGSMVSLSQIKSVRDGEQGDDDTVFATYLSFIHSKFKALQIQKSDFIYHNIHFTQFLIQDGKYIIFKLLFHNAVKQILEINYVVPQHIYAIDMAKAIESSIGTIDLLRRGGDEACEKINP